MNDARSCSGDFYFNKRASATGAERRRAERRRAEGVKQRRKERDRKPEAGSGGRRIMPFARALRRRAAMERPRILSETRLGSGAARARALVKCVSPQGTSTIQVCLPLPENTLIVPRVLRKRRHAGFLMLLLWLLLQWRSQMAKPPNHQFPFFGEL